MMRLPNARTYELDNLAGSELLLLEYVILSHTRGLEDEEVHFRDIQRGGSESGHRMARKGGRSKHT
jgi:hypothetical protein